MRRLLASLQSLGQSARGQGITEYALILALIAVAAVLALLFLSGKIDSIFSLVGDQLKDHTGGGLPHH